MTESFAMHSVILKRPSCESNFIGILHLKSFQQLKCGCEIDQIHIGVNKFEVEHVFFSWGETESTWYCGQCLAYCTSPR
jgi:hypothetical protein